MSSHLTILICPFDNDSLKIHTFQVFIIIGSDGFVPVFVVFERFVLHEENNEERLKEELVRARTRVRELESQLVKREDGRIDGSFWDVCEAMLAGICLHEIVFDDNELHVTE